MRSNLGVGFLYFILTAFLTGYIIFSDSEQNWDLYVLSSGYLIVLFSSARVFLFTKFNYSLDQVVNLFVFFFFGIAPTLQFKTGVVLWAQDRFSSEEYFRLNILILIIQIVYTFVYQKAINRPIKRNYLFKLLTSDGHFNSSKIVLGLLTITSALIFFYSQGFNVYQIMLRSLSEDFTGDSSRASSGAIVQGSFALILNNFIRPIPVICLLYYKLSKTSSRFDSFELFLILFVLTACAPTGMQRFLAAGLYIPLLIAYSPKVRKKFAFSLSLIGGLLLIFPFLNQFRRYSGELSIKFQPEIFLQGHFDAFQNFMGAINEGFVSNGKQLLGVFLFFVPRSFWPDKPISSGRQLGEDLSYSFGNISMPFFAEGYINFGFIGILIFTIVLGRFNCNMDKLYWNQLEFISTKGIIVFLIFMGLEFFILRGALLSAFAYSCGIVSAVFVINKLGSK
jgi:hypothetical protein